MSVGNIRGTPAPSPRPGRSVVPPVPALTGRVVKNRRDLDRMTGTGEVRSAVETLSCDVPLKEVSDVRPPFLNEGKRVSGGLKRASNIVG